MLLPQPVFEPQPLTPSPLPPRDTPPSHLIPPPYPKPRLAGPSVARPINITMSLNPRHTPRPPHLLLLHTHTSPLQDRPRIVVMVVIPQRQSRRRRSGGQIKKLENGHTRSLITSIKRTLTGPHTTQSTTTVSLPTSPNTQHGSSIVK
jgi:hypothetical protein